MHHLATATFGLALVWAQTGTATGYLPATGPAPLRFQKPAPVASLVLPPLLMHDPVPPAPEAAVAKPAPVVAKAPAAAEAPVAAPAQPTVTPAPAPAPVAIQTNAMNVVVPPPTLLPTTTSDTNAPAVLSPQMLLHFFNQRNAPNRATTIVTPVEFSPARPPAPPSSTSTYISPPKTP